VITWRALVLLTALGACSIPDKQFTGQRDGGPSDGAGDGSGGGPFGCIGHETQLHVPLALTWSGKVVTLFTSQPLGNEPVVAIDTDTGAQIATTTSDSIGSFVTQIFTSGAPIPVTIRVSTSGSQDLATVLVPSHALDADLDVTVEIAAQSDMTQLYAPVAKSWDPGGATVLATIVDCMGTPIQGASLTVGSSSGGSVVYFTGSNPDGSATQTDASGRVLVLNAAPGSAMFSASKPTVPSFLQYSVTLQAASFVQLTIQP
jgi:hypothetical protein